MILKFCAVCGVDNDLQQHHIEPVVYSKNGRKNKNKRYDSNKKLKDCTSQEMFAFLFDQGVISDDGTITVCSFHHHILHGIMKFQKHEHNKLIKEGQRKAKERGVKIGRPSKITNELRAKIISDYEYGTGIRKLSKKFGVGVGTIYSTLREKSEDIHK